ncbi:ferrous iron transport protein A [Candidatus Desantisbacteria bacterium]|nr:ferrous iron transport protein A [Candidatus Desantisbacteria bacterium]
MENIDQIPINSHNTKSDVNSANAGKYLTPHSSHITKNQANANIFTLVDMESDWDGVIVEIRGGHVMASRLSTLGLMVGAKIKKISQHILQGPVVVEIGRTQIAIGIGIAKKVLVCSNPIHGVLLETTR